MLLSCVTIVGQRVTSVLWVLVRYEHIWTHAYGCRSLSRRGTLWHSAYEVFEFNQLAHAFEIRSTRQLVLKARLTSNTIMPVDVIDHCSSSLSESHESLKIEEEGGEQEEKRSNFSCDDTRSFYSLRFIKNVYQKVWRFFLRKERKWSLCVRIGNCKSVGVRFLASSSLTRAEIQTKVPLPS